MATDRDPRRRRRPNNRAGEQKKSPAGAGLKFFQTSPEGELRTSERYAPFARTPTAPVPQACAPAGNCEPIGRRRGYPRSAVCARGRGGPRVAPSGWPLPCGVCNRLPEPPPSRDVAWVPVSIHSRIGRACTSLPLDLTAIAGEEFGFALRFSPPVITAPAAFAALVLPGIGGGCPRGERHCGGE